MPSQEDITNRGLGAVVPTSYATYVDRWAIVVGISKYKHENLNLKYAHRDAEALCELLLTPSGGGFEKEHVVKLVNEEATTANITRALRSFLKKPAKEDIVLIYFACHGTPDIDRPGIVYLLTHDVDPGDISGTALPMREIDLSLKENLLAERVIILADTCHSAAIGGGIGRRDAGDNSAVVNSYLREVSKTRGGVALLTSAEANEVSFEDTKWGEGHGVFTHYLLEGMKGAADRNPKNGVVTVGELFEYVRENVQRATENKQHPCVGTNSYDRNLPVAITAGISAQEHYELGCQLYQIGMKLHDLGRLQSASRHLQEAIRLARITGIDLAEAHLQLGILFMNIGNLPRAIESFHTAAKANIPDATYYLGVAYEKNKEPKKSLQVLNSFLKKYPQNQKVPWVQEFMQQQRNQYTGNKYALLIGIDNYNPASGLSPLNGSLNDVELIYNLIIDKYEFPAENITILKDSDATYERIVLELQKLHQSDSKDIIIIHFSGHSIESIEYQNYLVVYDSFTPFNKSAGGDNQTSINQPQFSRVLTVEQLHNLVNSIPGHTTFILDTHANQNFIDLAESGKYTLLLATSPGLMAHEQHIKEKRYGLFTYSLVEQLRHSVSNLKIDQLRRCITDRIQSLGGIQQPIFIDNRDGYFLSSHNHLLDSFDFSQYQEYSAFLEEQIEHWYDSSFKRLTVQFPEFYQSIGQAFFEKGNYKRAISSFQVALEQHQSDHSDLFLALGTAQFLAEHYTDAIKTFRQYSESDKLQRNSAHLQTVLCEIERLRTPKHFALLVGINCYFNSYVPNLHGAVNDVLSLKNILVESYNFEEENVLVLKDNDATCENILKCFKNLVSSSKDAPSLFYFAGNGSLNYNSSLTILGVDSREPDIYDIDLNDLVSIAGEHSSNLISIIDAGWANAIDCPRGGRVVRPDSRLITVKPPNTRVKKKDLTSSNPDNLINRRDLSSSSYQIGYASIYPRAIQFGLYEKSYEIQGEKDFIQRVGNKEEKKTHGILTFALLEILQSNHSNTLTYSQLIQSISKSLNSEPYGVGTDLMTQIFNDFSRKEVVNTTLKRIKQQPLRQTAWVLHHLIEQRNNFDPDGYLNLGVIRYFLHEPENSIVALESALTQIVEQQFKATDQLKAEQNSADVHYWLGRVLYETSCDPARAVSELRLAIQHNPANAAAHYYLGQALRSLMNQELMTEAERAFDIYLQFGAPLGHRKELQAFLEKNVTLDNQEDNHG